MTTAPLRASPRVPQSNEPRPGGRGVDLTIVGNTAIDLDQTVAEKPSKLKLAPPVPVAVPRTPFIVLVVLIVVAGVLGILVLNTKINQNAFKIADLRAAQTGLDLREQALEQYIAEREAPGSLAAAAAKLGLTDSGPPAFILLPDGKIIGVPRPAQGPVSNASQ